MVKPSGRLTSASQTGNALSFTYDALSRNLTQVGPQGTVASQWDIAGRRTRLTYPGSGLFVDYDYLVTGEMTKIRENGATSGVGVLATFAYDDLGRRTSLTFGNGASQGYGFDAASRLSSLTANLTGTASDLTLGSFSYNPAGQITGQNRSNDAYAWLGSVVVNRNYTSNGLNQLTTSGSIVPTYDARGNLTSAGTTTYAYNSENMLVSASGGTSATLAYDPALRLTQVASGPTTTRFSYDGLDLIAEYDGSNILQRRYVHGPGMDQPLVQYEGTGTTDRHFLSADERGSIISLTDSSGALLGINKYDEYGNPQAGNLGAFGYTGQAWVPSMGVWYYKARVYDPELGRFLQADPIDVEGGINLYAYVGNDPVNWIDPLGLCGVFSRGGVIVVSACIGSGVGGGSGGANIGSRPDDPSVFERLERPERPEVDPCNAPLPDGSTINQNVDTTKKEVEKVENLHQVGDPRGLGWYYAVGAWIARVQPRGKWDYKRFGGTEEQGNMNFGATGTVLFPMDVLLRGAGSSRGSSGTAPRISF